MYKKVLGVAVAASLVMGGALPAFAEEVVDDAEVSAEASNVNYFEEDHILLYSVEGDCTLTEDMTIEFTEDEAGNIVFTVSASGEPADDSGSGFEAPVVEVAPIGKCVAILVEGPNGQVNHGTVVSNLVKALKAMDDLEGPLGQALKAAKADIGDLGKGDTKVKTKDAKEADADADLDVEDDDDSDIEDSAKPAKREKADNPNKGKGRNK